MINRDKIIQSIERELSNMYAFLRALPAPCLLYSVDGRVLWCNQTMLSLFWGTEVEPAPRPLSAVENRHVRDVMPDYLWPYVLEQNQIVHDNDASQFEAWSDEVWVGVRWQCLRFPAGAEAVGVVLIPENEDHLKKCDSALRMSESPNGTG